MQIDLLLIHGAADVAQVTLPERLRIKLLPNPPKPYVTFTDSGSDGRYVFGTARDRQWSHRNAYRDVTSVL